MKKNYVLSLFAILVSQIFQAQTTETFESSTVGTSTFTNGSFVSTLTPSSAFKVATLVGSTAGYLSSAKYLENTSANACSITSTTTFKVVSLYLYPSTDGGNSNQTAGVSVTFTGKLAGTTVFTYTPPAADFAAAQWSNTTNRGFSLVNFATPGYQNMIIDELVTDIGGAGNYIAIDHFTFTPAPISTITTIGTPTAFSSCAGTVSAAQNFTVAGANLTANITVTAPTGFEVSTASGSGYGSSVTLTQASGTVATTTVYARLSAAATGSPSGNITCVSTGASTKNIAVSGTVTTLPIAYNVTGTGSYCAGGTGVAVGLANSETGVSYQLKNGVTAVGSAVVGTGSAISFGNQTTAATYTVVATKTTGSCTATMTGTAVVTITTINPSVTLSSGVLTATQLGATTYQWYKCSDNSTVGTNTNTYTPTSTGDYKVAITIGSCTVTSSCVTVSTLGTVLIEPNAGFVIYPNPSQGIINIQSDVEGDFQVVNQLGQVVKTFRVEANSSKTVDLQSLKDTIYFIREVNHTKSLKLIIKK